MPDGKQELNDTLTDAVLELRECDEALAKAENCLTKARAKLKAGFGRVLGTKKLLNRKSS